MRHTSIGARPERIHSAITRPTPPAPAMPCAQNPAATKKPPTSGASPRMNSPSGVNASGPLIIVMTSARPIDGTRETACAIRSSNRSQSGARSLCVKSRGIPSSPQGSGERS